MLLTDADEYRRMSRSINPYGDGKAAERIVEIVRRKLPAIMKRAAAGGSIKSCLPEKNFSRWNRDVADNRDSGRYAVYSKGG